MHAPKLMAVVVTEAPLDEVRLAAAAHDFSFEVEPADVQYPVGNGHLYEVLHSNDAEPRPNVARTLRAELGGLWPGTIVCEVP